MNGRTEIAGCGVRRDAVAKAERGAPNQVPPDRHLRLTADRPAGVAVLLHTLYPRPAGELRLADARRALFHRSTWARAAAAALLALSGALALPATAQADVLVSNIERSTDETAPLDDNTYFGQAFTVGRTVDYTLTSIDIPFAANGISAAYIGVLEVRVWSVDSSGFLDRSLYTLTNPSSITADATVSFTAPAGATLRAGRTYVVVVYYNRALSSDQPRLSFTDNAGENAEFTGYLDAGWSIANSSLEFQFGGESWTEREEC